MMNRKEFISRSALGLAGLALTGFAPPAPPPPDYTALYQGRYDALIVGSGYGGAVAARRLAEKGKKVLLIEMGLDWAASGHAFSAMAWATKESTWLRRRTVAPFGNYRVIPKFTGALDRLDFAHVKVYAGRGLGGGSLVNGGMAVTPKRAYFEEVFPQLDSEAFYSRWFPLANAELGATTMPEEQYQHSAYYAFSRRGEEEAHKAGFRTARVPNVYDFNYLAREEAGQVPKSALGGEVIYGNNHGKKDLTKTYLKKALATGNVAVLPLHRVHFVEKTADGYLLRLHQLNTHGDTEHTVDLRTRALFLAGGSLGTTELLLRSVALGKLPINNPALGQGWGNNGNVMLGRNFVRGGTGARQSTIPAAGVDNWDDPAHSFFCEIAPLPISLEAWAALYLCINRVPRKGSIRYDAALDKAVVDWGPANTAHMVENARYFLDKLNKANGGTYAHLLFQNGVGADICYHPLGGCVLGAATDERGQLRGAEHLYVVDGALIPGTVGVNPYVTITAVAEFLLDAILTKGLP